MKKWVLGFVFGFLFFVSYKPIVLGVDEEPFISKKELLSPIGVNKSQYSPWVMHEPGWGSYLMYYCKMEDIDGVWQDRVYRTESWSDGKTKDWTGDMVVIQGNLNQKDDLSCSPGVVIDKRNPSNEVWRMYYITAQRGADCDLYIYHATSKLPGVNWEKKGLINISGLNWPVVGCGIETPSPYIINNKVVLFLPGPGGKIYKTESEDGTNFSGIQLINIPDVAPGAGRVYADSDNYYYVYGRNSSGNVNLPTNQIWMTRSNDGGINYVSPKKLMESSGVGWDGERMWSPQLIKFGNEWRIYYAGNIGTYQWFGANTSIGVRTYSDLDNLFEVVASPTPICSVSNGDYNKDGLVNITDLVGWYNFFKLGSYESAADFNSDDNIDIQDLIIWYGGYRK